MVELHECGKFPAGETAQLHFKEAILSMDGPFIKKPKVGQSFGYWEKISYSDHFSNAKLL